MQIKFNDKGPEMQSLKAVTFYFLIKYASLSSVLYSAAVIGYVDFLSCVILILSPLWSVHHFVSLLNMLKNFKKT